MREREEGGAENNTNSAEIRRLEALKGTWRNSGLVSLANGVATAITASVLGRGIASGIMQPLVFIAWATVTAGTFAVSTAMNSREADTPYEHVKASATRGLLKSLP